MSRLEYIKWCIAYLKIEGKSQLKRYRFAGSLEAFLIEEGFITSSDTQNRKSGGKCYIPYIADFRWIETYPNCMLRKGEEFLASSGTKT